MVEHDFDMLYGDLCSGVTNNSQKPQAALPDVIPHDVTPIDR